MNTEYIFVLFLFVLALGLGGLFTLLGILLGPKEPSETKKKPFECGWDSEGVRFGQYHVRFYMVALAFLVFDVEIVFFYPWAVNFQEFGVYGFAAMGVFFLLLLLGLAYDWNKGALEWE